MRQFCTLAVAALCTQALCGHASAQILIDDFSTGNYASGTVNTQTTAFQTGAMLANARDTEVNLNSGTASMTISSGTADCFSSPNSFTNFFFQYDGIANAMADDNATNEDFSLGDAFLITFDPANNAGQARHEMTVSDTSGTTQSSPITLHSFNSSLEILIPFSAFPSVDFSAIDRVTLRLRDINPGSTTIVIDSIETVNLCEEDDILIDDFRTGPYASGSVSSQTLAAQAGSMIGGSRDTEIDIVSANADMSIGAGVARCISDANSFSDFNFTYDGRANTVDDDDLIRVDLSCKNVVRLTFGPGTTGPVRTQLTLNDRSGNNRFGPVLIKDVTGGGTVDHPLCNFSTIDLANLDRIKIQIENNNPATTEFFLESIIATIEPCPADINKDGLANPADFTAWLGCFNAPGSQTYCNRADVNANGTLEPSDFTAWLAAFNLGCI